MLASFIGWNDEPGYLVPENADLFLNYRQYQLIMNALKTYAVENDIYTEVAEIVQLVSDIEQWYKVSRDRHISEES